MNQYDEDKAKKTQYKLPGRDMEMSWEFSPKVNRPENSTTFSDLKHHNSHRPGEEAYDAETQHRQRN